MVRKNSSNKLLEGKIFYLSEIHDSSLYLKFKNLYRLFIDSSKYEESWNLFPHCALSKLVFFSKLLLWWRHHLVIILYFINIAICGTRNLTCGWSWREDHCVEDVISITYFNRKNGFAVIYIYIYILRCINIDDSKCDETKNVSDTGPFFLMAFTGRNGVNSFMKEAKQMFYFKNIWMNTGFRS